MRRSLKPEVCRLFDVRASRHRPPTPSEDVLRAARPAPGALVLVTGPSGAGKSTLLNRLRESIECNQVDLGTIALPRRAAVDCVADALGGADDELTSERVIVEALTVLSSAGLAEARDYLRTPSRLSEGQRFRLRLSIALARASRAHAAQQSTVLICDEYAASLDDLTGAVVSRCLRRTVTTHRGWISALVATGRSALRAALSPDVVVHCDFDQWRIERSDATPRDDHPDRRK